MENILSMNNMDNPDYHDGNNSEGDVRDDSMDNIDDNPDFTPQIGMEFQFQEDAYKFYNEYALKTGFGIRWSSTTKSKTDKDKVISRKFVCNKEGQKKLKNIEEDAEKEVVHNRQSRVGCKARMKIIRTKSDTWKVSGFVEQHDNHELTSPTKTSRHRSHQMVHRKPIVKNLITKLHSEGITNSEIAKVVNVLESNQHDHVTPQQVHDHLRIERKNNIGQNCGKVIKHFQEKRASDLDFYFSLQLTEDLTLRSVFWADGRSRDSYQKFSDVIVFDVTYRTNNFSLPFAPFTGINHHRQSSLFGCALLADETEETFVWLFQQWLTCMGGNAPGAIITDQDAAIGNAIARVFPNTVHRYCDWHLDRNIGEHMLHLKAAHGIEFEIYFNRLRDSNSIPEAEECWKELMMRYKLREKSWLPKLWEKRRSWIPCYLKDTFMAGTRTSQRSESINAFFDSFVNANTALNEFVLQYDKALVSRRTAEEDADFQTMNSIPMLITFGWKAEEQAGRCYTKALFAIFKQELKDAVIYWAEKVHKEGTLTKFIVGLPNSDKSKWRNVIYDNSDEVTVSCECKQFEFTGLLCRHALNILWKKRVPEIPDRYILKRWTIDARYRCVSIGLHDSAPTEADPTGLYWSIQYKYNKALEEARNSPTFAVEFDKILSKTLADVDNLKRKAQTVEFDTHSKELGSQVGSSNAPISQNMDLFPEFSIHDPRGSVRTKGRPKESHRIQSGLEESQEESNKKQRKCGLCGDKGHYRTGCLKAKVAAAATSASAGQFEFPPI